MNRIVELLRLIDSCRLIKGRKKLQKMVHILREAGYAFPYRFGFHYHGPFSAELKAEIDVLVDQEYVAEDEDSSFSGDFRQYIYKTTEKGSHFLREVDHRPLPNWSGLAKELGGKNAQELETISTILYLRRQGYSDSQLSSQFKVLKPQLIERLNGAEEFIKREIDPRAKTGERVA